MAERWLRDIVPNRWARYGAAFAGVLVGATSWTVWNQSTVNEKVYTVSLLSIALVMWLVVRWGDDEPGPHRDRWLVLIAYVLALTSTNHLMGVLAVPALAVYVLWTDWRVAVRPWAMVTFWALLLAVTGKWLDMFVGDGPTGPVADPVDARRVGLRALAVAEGSAGLPGRPRGRRRHLAQLPLAAAPRGAVSRRSTRASRSACSARRCRTCSTGCSTASRRSPSARPPSAPSWPTSGSITAGSSPGTGGASPAIATALFTGARPERALGAVEDATAGPASPRLALLGTLTVGLVYYMNFKYGFSQYPDQPSLPREVRERDYFFIGSFSAFGVFVALGLGAADAGIVEFLRDRGTRTAAGPRRAWCSRLALIPLLGNRVTASRADETMARDFAHDILQSVEPYGILITAGDNDTFPLWYAQEVEGIRRDVTLANLSLMNTEWHLRQLRRRETPEFDPAGAAPLWREVRCPRAAQGAGAESAAGGARQSSRGDAGAARRRRGVRQPADPVRPGHPDAAGSGDDLSHPRQPGQAADLLQLERRGLSRSDLGLSPYLVSQGFVRKLMPTPVVANDSIVLSPGLGYLDLPRTEKLLWDVYHWQTATRDRPDGWVDPPSGSILQLYSVVYGGAARLCQGGDSTLAARADSVARAVSGELRQGAEF